VLQDQLDLHGLTVVEARELLIMFLNECRRHDARCVRIIHGKGLRSKNREPVLRNKVASWLMQRDEVLAFCQARRADGGSGAVVVLLKAARRPSRNP
jgi:DNA-nicking Smr family endonuclease